MADNSADKSELADIRLLASEPSRVELTTTALYDLMGAELTKNDVCREILAWIDSGERMKKVVLRGRHAGQVAFEMKPRINKTLFYVKVTRRGLDEQEPHLLIISAHPNH